MHWCPDCHEPCFCDSDDTDYGDMMPDGCPHECQNDADEYYYEDDDEELQNEKV